MSPECGSISTDFGPLSTDVRPVSTAFRQVRPTLARAVGQVWGDLDPTWPEFGQTRFRPKSPEACLSGGEDQPIIAGRTTSVHLTNAPCGGEARWRGPNGFRPLGACECLLRTPENDYGWGGQLGGSTRREQLVLHNEFACPGPLQQPPGAVAGRFVLLAAHCTGCADLRRSWRLEGHVGPPNRRLRRASVQPAQYPTRSLNPNLPAMAPNGGWRVRSHGYTSAPGHQRLIPPLLRQLVGPRRPQPAQRGRDRVATAPAITSFSPPPLSRAKFPLKRTGAQGCAKHVCGRAPRTRRNCRRHESTACKGSTRVATPDLLDGGRDTQILLQHELAPRADPPPSRPPPPMRTFYRPPISDPQRRRKHVPSKHASSA